MRTGKALGERELPMMSGVARGRFAHFTDEEVRDRLRVPAVQAGAERRRPRYYSGSSVMLRKSTPSERSLRYRCVRSMPTRLASWPTLPLHSSSCCCR